jgi:hypothetical protein
MDMITSMGMDIIRTTIHLANIISTNQPKERPISLGENLVPTLMRKCLNLRINRPHLCRVLDFEIGC